MSSNKYKRTIYSATGVALQDKLKRPCLSVDVYCVLEAFGVTCPARQHAIKKLLCAGERGSKSAAEDLHEAAAALERAIDMELNRTESIMVTIPNPVK